MSYRSDNIHNSLSALRERGYIKDWVCSSPGDNGKRWSVWGSGFENVFSTREVEVFILGAKSVIFALPENNPPVQN